MLCKTCNKNQVTQGRICNTCKMKKYRKNNPIKAAYFNLRCNAKRRGKKFDLSFEEFKTFAIETKYYKKKGIFSTSLHIDRIDETKGYSIDNIQTLTNSANVKKHLNYKYNEETHEMDYNVVTSKINKNFDTPF